MSDAALEQYADLERALLELAPQVAFPPTPDLSSSIRAHIAAHPAPRRVGWQWPALLQPRRLAIAFLALLVILGAAVTLSPGLRTSIAKRLGVHGIEIIFVDETPTPQASPAAGATLLLGDPMTLAEAQSRTDYVIQVPTELGPPDEVYVRQVSAGPMVTLLYRAREGLPAATETGVGALLMQFPISSEAGDIAKRVSLGMGSVSEVRISDTFGYWITGASELVIDQDPSTSFVDSVSRPSADVLIWEQDGLTFRLELNGVRSDAIRIAESMQPTAP